MSMTFEQLEARVLLHGEALIDAPHEHIPNYVQHPDTETIADGNWFDPSIWSNGVPTEETDVEINHSVVISSFSDAVPGDANGDGVFNTDDYPIIKKLINESILAGDFAPLIELFEVATPAHTHAVAENINVYGSLSFDAESETRLNVQTLTVFGELEVGTADAPITGSVEIIFRDTPFDYQFDPQQLGHGLLVLDHARISVYGQSVTSFVEVAEAPLAGDRVLTLSEVPQAWLPGNELWIADTRDLGRHRPDFSQAERLTIEAVDGNHATLSQELAFDHLGDGDFLPHIAHLSGNVTFRSENPDGVRGHILVTDRADVRVHNAVFDELGRTTVEFLDNTHLDEDRNPLHIGQNQVGRYTFHLHHLYGPEDSGGAPQFELVGNRFTNGKKWGVAIHDSHFGLVQDNVLVNFQGSGVVFEDGSELGNRIEGNFIGLVPGSGQGVQSRVGANADPLGKVARGSETATHEAGVLWGDGTEKNPYRTLGDLGHEGAGIWGRSASNHIVDNVIANTQIGNVLWTRFFGDPHLPAFQGADTRTDFVVGHSGQQLDHEYRGQEVYGSNEGIIWLGVAQKDLNHGTPQSVFYAENTKVWRTRLGMDIKYSGEVQLVNAEFRLGLGLLRTNFTAVIGFEDVSVIGTRQQVSEQWNGELTKEADFVKRTMIQEDFLPDAYLPFDPDLMTNFQLWIESQFDAILDEESA